MNAQVAEKIFTGEYQDEDKTPEAIVKEFYEQATEPRPIGKLAGALAKAQGEIMNAHKSESNPFFKSKYADLKSCWDACRDALSKNEIAVIQMPEANSKKVTVKTILAHSSGEYLENYLDMPLAKSDAHGVGSAITYARRYALVCMVGIAPEDDDGNAAAKGGSAPEKKP